MLSLLFSNALFGLFNGKLLQIAKKMWLHIKIRVFLPFTSSMLIISDHKIEQIAGL